MHPEIMLELMNQHVAETRTRSQRARLARLARELARDRRNPAKAHRASSGPKIPDYVHEMFGER